MEGNQQTLLLKAIIAIFLSVLIFLLYRQKAIRSYLESKSMNFVFIAATLFLRIIPFLAIYVLLGVAARSDVHMFYDSALSAKKLLFVYRDFDSAYSPLFPYITAIPLVIWDNAAAIIGLMILLEALVLWLSYAIKPTLQKIWIPIYYLLPISFILCLLGGQEDFWLWGIFVWVVWHFQKHKSDLWVGIILGIGLLVTKALMILYIPAILLAAKKPIQVILGLLLVGIPSLAIMYYHSEMLFLSPIQQANDPRTPNLWTVLHPLTNGLVPLGPKWLNWFGLVTIQCFAVYIAIKNKSKVSFEKFIVQNFLLVSILIMIIQQSSLANYSYIYLMPLLLFVHWSPKELLLLILLNIVLVIQPPIWWGLGMPQFHSLADLNAPIKIIEYLLECLALTGLFWLLIKCLKADNIKLA